MMTPTAGFTHTHTHVPVGDVVVTRRGKKRDEIAIDMPCVQDGIAHRIELVFSLRKQSEPSGFEIQGNFRIPRGSTQAVKGLRIVVMNRVSPDIVYCGMKRQGVCIEHRTFLFGEVIDGEAGHN